MSDRQDIIEADQFADHIEADKVLFVHYQVPTIVWGVFVGALPLFMVYKYDPKFWIFKLWIIAYLLCSILRYLYYRMLDPASGNIEKIINHGTGQTIFSAAGGIIWGIGSVVLYEPVNTYAYMVFVLLLLLSFGGALIIHSAQPKAAFSFALFALFPMCINLSWQNISDNYLIVIIFLFYLIFSLRLCLNGYHTIEESLRRKYENLSLVKTLEQQAEQLQGKTQEAEKANLDKSRFLAAASHDLRQPLHSLNLFAGILEDELNTNKQKHIFNKINDNINVLSKQFDGLLDISRLDTKVVSVKQTSVSLQEILQQIEEQYLLQAEQKGLELFITKQDVMIKTDINLLKQILDNFVSNAIRYTKTGSVHIDFKVDNKSVIISVRDTGIGIAENEIENIFDEYYQLSNNERNPVQGFGLGLAIVRRQAALLGHNIKAESELDKGTTFSIEVPLADKQEIAKDDETELLSDGEQSLSGKRVLLIEDEFDILQATQYLLERWGCVVMSAGTSEDALNIIATLAPPDLIISDYRLPGHMNGLELIKTIQTKLNQDVSALLISGDTDPKILRAIDQNQIVLLHKPLRAETLSIILNRLLKEHNTPAV